MAGRACHRHGCSALTDLGEEHLYTSVARLICFDLPGWAFSSPGPHSNVSDVLSLLVTALETLAAIIENWSCKDDSFQDPAHCKHVEDAAGILVHASDQLQQLRRMQLVKDHPCALSAPEAESLTDPESSALELVCKAVSKYGEEEAKFKGHDDWTSSTCHVALFDALYLCITSCVKGLASTTQLLPQQQQCMSTFDDSLIVSSDPRLLPLATLPAPIQWKAYMGIVNAVTHLQTRSTPLSATVFEQLCKCENILFGLCALWGLCALC
jgi:hypothetical protein